MEKYVLSDFIGKTFNKLTICKEATVEDYIRSGKKICGSRQIVECLCECGNRNYYVLSHVVKGGVKSCGCLHKKHGMFGSRLYNIWHSMKERCETPSATSYHNYGKNGVAVCEEWKEFIPFMQWAYQNGYDESAKRGECTLDRIDVNGNYCPDNCRWVDMKMQGNNRSTNRYIEYNGKQYTVTNFAREFDLDPVLVERRVLDNWNVEDLFLSPKDGKNKNIKRVIQKSTDGDFIKEWESANAVEESLGYSARSVRRCCSGDNKTSFGYKWEYVS